MSTPHLCRCYGLQMHHEGTPSNQKWPKGKTALQECMKEKIIRMKPIRPLRNGVLSKEAHYVSSPHRVLCTTARERLNLHRNVTFSFPRTCLPSPPPGRDFASGAFYQHLLHRNRTQRTQPHPSAQGFGVAQREVCPSTANSVLHDLELRRVRLSRGPSSRGAPCPRRARGR